MPALARASGRTCSPSGKGQAKKGVRALEHVGVQGGGFRTLGSCRHGGSPGFRGRITRGENDGVARSLGRPQEEAAGDFQR